MLHLVFETDHAVTIKSLPSLEHYHIVHINYAGMGGWKLETGRFALMVAFPVVAFWIFNQPSIFKVFMKGYKVPDSSEGDAAVAKWKEQLLAQKRKEEYEHFLREQMAFEEARRRRDQQAV
ncbi:unnamed protein product [Cylicocyclus nassatus]|uniref:Uncharacterized protein n=1 Tax=Cylicocyclus nassatus TaxID=53992 RepID=A0AA36H9A9_CYLNA|nr:unnamed protein product [Cylicocyclus nassatus]